MMTDYIYKASLSRRIRVWTAACALALMTGCSLLRTPETRISATPASYETVRITYQQMPSSTARPATPVVMPPAGDVQLASFAAPLNVDQRGDASQSASLQSGPAQAGATQRARTLSLQYPHPAGRNGYALAELVVEKPFAAAPGDPSRASPSWLGSLNSLLRDNLPGVAFGDGVEQAWALDIPVAEVDLVIDALDAQGYFAEVTPAAEFTSPATSPLLAARINGLRVEKRWGSAPELETLIARVRREGKLVSHLQNVERLHVDSPETAAVLLRLPPVVATP